MKVLRRCLTAFVLVAAGCLVGGASVLTWARHHPPVEMPPQRWEATVYLPLADNAGKLFADTELQAAIGVLIQEFGGATLLKEQREGYWLDDQQHICREPVRPLIVSFDHDRLADFRRAVREAGRRLGQECMYVRLEEPRVDLVFVNP